MYLCYFKLTDFYGKLHPLSTIYKTRQHQNKFTVIMKNTVFIRISNTVQNQKKGNFLITNYTFFFIFQQFATCLP